MGEKQEKPAAAVMGYPASMDQYPDSRYTGDAHNQYHPPYYPAPNNFNNHQPAGSRGYDPVFQAPHNLATSANGYYGHYDLPMMPEADRTTHFGRVILILMIVVVAGMCAMSLVMWFLFGNYIPQFQVSSFKLTNFTATNSSFTGGWESNITIFNENEDLKVHLDTGRVLIFYREYVIGIYSVEPFVLEEKQSYNLNLSVPAVQLVNEDILQNTVLPGLNEDQKNGVMVFSLRLGFDGNFTATDAVFREEAINVYCENLMVNVSSGGGGGWMNEGAGSECLVRVRGRDDGHGH